MDLYGQYHYANPPPIYIECLPPPPPPRTIFSGIALNQSINTTTFMKENF